MEKKANPPLAERGAGQPAAVFSRMAVDRLLRCVLAADPNPDKATGTGGARRGVGELKVKSRAELLLVCPH